MHDKLCILCRQIEAATPGNGKKEVRKMTRCVLLLQENAPAHMLQVAMTAVTECEFVILSHPPYSPHKALSDVYLFPKLKSNLCGT